MKRIKKHTSLLITLCILFMLNRNINVYAIEADPPVISNIAASFNPTMSVGDTITISCSITDESAINNVQCILGRYSESHSTIFTDMIFPLTYNISTEKYEASYTLPDTLKNGAYMISIDATDEHGNHRSSRLSNALTDTDFTLTGGKENSTPVISNMSAGLTSTMNIGESLDVSCSVADESSLSYVICELYRYVSYSTLHLESDFLLSYNSSTHAYECSYILPDFLKNGTYRIYFAAEDEHGNFLRKEFSSGLTTVDFTLTGGKESNLPVISNPIIDFSSEMTDGDILTASCTVTDESAINKVQCQLGRYVASDNCIYCEVYFQLTYNVSSQKYEGSYVLPRTLKNGKYKISIEAEDEHGNIQSWSLSSLFEAIDFTYMSTGTAEPPANISDTPIENSNIYYENYNDSEVQPIVPTADRIIVDGKSVTPTVSDTPTATTEAMKQPLNDMKVAINNEAESAKILNKFIAQERTEITDIKSSGLLNISVPSNVDISNGVKITFTNEKIANAVKKGQKIMVLHLKKDGTWERVEAIAGNGNITATFTSLSPVAWFIVETNEMTTAPKTCASFLGK